MIINYKQLNAIPLFHEIDADKIQDVLQCLSAKIKFYPKNHIIFRANDKVTSMGIIYSGSAQVVKEDYFGNRNILTNLTTGGLFGESFSLSKTEKLPVSVVATSDCEILLIDYRKILTTCSATCEHHSQLIKNMLNILAVKNVILNQKIEFLTKRTTREKLLAYLSAEARSAGSLTFTIPFNRQELADFLCVDRSAMSNELSKLSREGLITYNRNQFKLIKK